MEKRNSITFALLIVALVFAYVRPYEILPALEQLKITKVALFGALVFSFFDRQKKGFILKEKSFRLMLGLELLTVALIPFYLRPAGSNDYWINSYLKVFAVFYLLLTVAGDLHRLRIILKTIFLSCCVVAARAISAYFSGSVIYEGGTRRVSGISMLSSSDPNDIALTFATAVPIGLYLMTSSKGLWRYFYAILTFLNIAAIVITGSRGGYLGLIVGFSVFIALLYWNRKAKLISVLAMVAILAVLAVPEEYKQRFVSSFDTAGYSYTDEKTGRLAIWKRGIKSALENPMGTGIKTYTITEGERRREAGFMGRWNSAHNSYIQIAVELGLLGLCLYLLLLWTGFRNLTRAVRASIITGDRDATVCAFALSSSLAGFMVSSLFLSQAYYWNQYIFVALATGLRIATERDAMLAHNGVNAKTARAA